MTIERRTSGNPIIPGIGVCDPHVRIYNDRAYLYATHDKSPESKGFVMDDWWIWSSPDLVDWQHACTIRPEETYYAQPDSSCWAVDAMEKNGRHYFFHKLRQLPRGWPHRTDLHHRGRGQAQGA